MEGWQKIELISYSASSLSLANQPVNSTTDWQFSSAVRRTSWVWYVASSIGPGNNQAPTSYHWMNLGKRLNQDLDTLLWRDPANKQDRCFSWFV